MGWRIELDDLSGEAIQALLRRHARGMEEHSPPGACHFLDLDGLRHPSITFWSIWEGEALAGCGALKDWHGTSGEVKSMRTADDHLGRGVGRHLLAHIVDEARRRRYTHLRLETGSSAGFAAACHLYESFGFERCEPFGDYTENEFSRFYSLAL